MECVTAGHVCQPSDIPAGHGPLVLGLSLEVGDCVDPTVFEPSVLPVARMIAAWQGGPYMGGGPEYMCPVAGGSFQESAAGLF